MADSLKNPQTNQQAEDEAAISEIRTIKYQITVTMSRGLRPNMAQLTPSIVTAITSLPKHSRPRKSTNVRIIFLYLVLYFDMH